MLKSCAAFASTLTGITMMALAISSASARSLSISNQTFRAVWNPVTLAEPLGGTVSCPMTLEGSLHSRTIAKVSYALIGYITRALSGVPASCTGGEMTILQETLPWHVRYFGFSGTLPNIAAVMTLVSGGGIRIRGPNGSCLITLRENTAEHGLVSLDRNVTTEQLTSAGFSGSITSNDACAFGLRVRFTFSGTSVRFSLLDSTALIFVRLI